MNAFDPERILRVLAARHVSYVLVGATAARLQGFPRLTAAADITPARNSENLVRLAGALCDLCARVYTESVVAGLPFGCDAATLSRAKLWNLVTDSGRLDVIFEPAGTQGFEDLARFAVTFQVFGIDMQAASLEDILRSKQALRRPQDQQDVLLLREMLERSE